MIALLAAMVVPYFARAGQQAQLEACRANLRAVGLGLAGYMNDHQGALPVARQLDNPHGELLAALCGPYVGRAEAFYCPAETRDELAFSRRNVDANCIGYFYYCCQRPSSNRGISTFLRWEVAWPRRLADHMDADTWVLSDAWSSGEPTAHSWFKKGVNYLTLDGQVRLVTDSPRQAFK